MSYTGTELFNLAIAVIDELSEAGTVNEAQVKEYKNRAPALLDLWQHEIKNIEGIAALVKVTALSQTMQVSDEGCMSGVYYLALHFAIADMNSELAGLCQGKYQALKDAGRKPSAGAAITDVYGVGGATP
jgi:hypothetical protein